MSEIYIQKINSPNSKLAACSKKSDMYQLSSLLTGIGLSALQNKYHMLSKYHSCKQLTPNDTSIYSIQFTHVPGSASSSFSTKEETLH